ncbi:DEAD/DEAH box helicase [Nocardia sp. CNY236]|uniref:DEAD/DEAH box helicase n=1 Tax=Nocardia sp. CNY236 TaxID=1169152 RepID=UPI000401FF17|nr:DEAD/DEAH box helicase [Nocardia sp. CNY236]
MTGSLWPHQLDAVTKICAALHDCGRATAVAACGTGKTVIGAECSARLAPNGPVLVLVPTLELLSQAAQTYSTHLGPATGPILAVCGDRTAADAATKLHAESTGSPPRVGTDPADLAQVLGDGRRATVLATYASLPVILAAHAEYGLPQWDLLVADEAHRTAGTKGQWTRVHDDRRIPARRRLYLTATPRIMTVGGDDIVSMDDPTVFGPRVFHLPFATAIEAGLLADYRVAVVTVTDTDVAELTTAHRVVRVAGRAVTARTLAMQIALAKAVRDYRLRRVITYHGRVAAAARFAAGLDAAIDLLPAEEKPPWPVRAHSVSGDMTSQQRRATLAELRRPGAATVVVSNARVLAEGVDVPALDAVMFADPRDSATDVTQAVGRALRHGGDRGKTATIIVPIFLVDGENPIAALDGSQFDTVWRVVRALRAHDERIGDYLDRARRNAGASERRGVEDAPPWLRLDGLPPRIGPEFHRSILLRTVRMTTSTWWENYGALLAFHAEHGHTAVPSGHRTADGRDLSEWLTRCRVAHRAGTLPRPFTEKLDDLGVEWNPLPARWDNGIAALGEFHAAHGHGEVPLNHVTATGFELGQWLRKRREYYRAGVLSTEHAAVLTSYGIDWHPSASRRNARWTVALRALADYRAAHGHTNVPVTYVTADGLYLGRWLQRRRTQYRDGSLPDELATRIRAEGVELVAESSSAQVWHRHLEALAAYRREHGHANPPQRFTTSDGFRLGAWLARCRTEHRRGRLGRAHLDALHALGVDLDSTTPTRRGGKKRRGRG